MTTLDRYVTRGFLFSYLLCFLVMMGLRTVSDLFVNMDEFAELSLPWTQWVAHVATYYGYHQLVYYQELGGVILVAAAAFSLARMNRTNELVAILASGTSLHRVIWPVVLAAMAITSAGVLNNEVFIPCARDYLALGRDQTVGSEVQTVRGLIDGQGTLWWSREFDPVEETLTRPMALLRDERYKFEAKVAGREGRWRDGAGWEIVGAIVSVPGQAGLSAEAVRSVASPAQVAGGAVLDEANGVIVSAEAVDLDAGVLINATFGILASESVGEPLLVMSAERAVYQSVPGDPGARAYALSGAELIVPSDLDPRELSLRESGKWMQFMASGEIAELLQTGKVVDVVGANLTRHIRVTEPVMNIVLLLLGVPFILSRERNIKASAGLCLAVVGAAYVFMYLARYLAGPAVPPIWAAWLPVLVFGPIAALLVESVKT